MASVDFTDFEALKYYRASDVAERLGIEIQIASNYAEAYEERYEQLSEAPRTNELLWSQNAFERIEKAHALVKSGSAENIKDALKIAKERVPNFESETNIIAIQKKQNFGYFSGVGFISALAFLVPFVFAFFSYYFIVSDVVLSDLNTEEKLSRASQVSYPLLIALASTAVLCFTYGQIKFKNEVYRKKIVDAGEKFFYSFVVLTIATFILLCIAYIPYDLSLGSPDISPDTTISEVLIPYAIAFLKFIPIAVFAIFLLAGLLVASNSISTLFSIMFFTPRSEKDLSNE